MNNIFTMYIFLFVIVVYYRPIFTNNVDIQLMDNNKAPLYAMLNMENFNLKTKRYVESIVTDTLGDLVNQTVKDVLQNQNTFSSTSSKTETETINQVNSSDWLPIFIACPEIKRSVYRAWVTPSPLDDPLDLSPDSCSRDHQRRSIIDRWNWKEGLIDQVKLELYKGRYVDAMYLFDGKGSTSTSWFSKENLLQTSYHDLSRTASTHTFSIKGYYGADRHFHINRNIGGCPNDAGWLLVVDTRHRLRTPACGFDRLADYEYPYFMYATRNKAGRYDNEGDFGFADMMVVSVKFV